MYSGFLTLVRNDMSRKSLVFRIYFLENETFVMEKNRDRYIFRCFVIRVYEYVAIMDFRQLFLHLCLHVLCCLIILNKKILSDYHTLDELIPFIYLLDSNISLFSKEYNSDFHICLRNDINQEVQEFLHLYTGTGIFVKIISIFTLKS